MVKIKAPTPDGQIPESDLPPTLPNLVSAVDDTPSVGSRSSTPIGSTATNVRPYSRPLPTKKVPAPIQDTKKRRHAARSRTVRDSDVSTSDEDELGSFDGDDSSGGSASDVAPAGSKRPRTSRIVTRYSSRTSAPDASNGGEPVHYFLIAL